MLFTPIFANVIYFKWQYGKFLSVVKVKYFNYLDKQKLLVQSCNEISIKIP